MWHEIHIFSHKSLPCEGTKHISWRPGILMVLKPNVSNSQGVAPGCTNAPPPNQRTSTNAPGLPGRGWGWHRWNCLMHWALRCHVIYSFAAYTCCQKLKENLMGFCTTNVTNLWQVTLNLILLFPVCEYLT